MKRYSWCTWSGLSGMVMTSCLVPSLEADLPESVGGPGNGSGTGGATTRTKSTVTGGRANSTNTRPSSDASSIAFGGGSAIASGGSGGTTACGTTPSKFDPIETDFGLSSSLAGSGFREHSGSGIKDGVIEYVKTTANLCSSGCLHLSAPFTKGIQAWSLSSSLIVEKELPGATNDTGVNLVGARIVAMVSVSNPDNVPVMFEIFAQGSAPDWGWSGGLDGASTLGDLGAFKEFAFLVHDATSVSDGRTLTFCASDTVKYGFKIQASKTITND
ncbi:MAG TPA: hypothetical protein VKP30_01910, partial [Polyangiaceae bacterium]|nr:hypothetical protein [Polyangiaceae bacterium]